MTKKKIELKKSKSHYTHFLSPSWLLSLCLAQLLQLFCVCI
jgi:hypothetical protein